MPLSTFDQTLHVIKVASRHKAILTAELASAILHLSHHVFIYLNSELAQNLRGAAQARKECMHEERFALWSQDIELVLQMCFLKPAPMHIITS
jgi:hypothetical protein